MTIHLFVIGWEGRFSAVQEIAEKSHTSDYITVVYSNRNDENWDGVGNWVKVPDSWYFGRKFRKCLEEFEKNPSDIMLLIQGDATFERWASLILSCKDNFQNHPDIGVWSPNIDYTYWDNKRVVISEHPIGSIVAQTDGIVFAFRSEIIPRLKELDYNCNNYGWAIECAAIAISQDRGKVAVRNQNLKVSHPKGSGYDTEEAFRQAWVFLDQLEPKERKHFDDLFAYCSRY